MATFYICPTPIGNLEDISQRLVNTLSKVDVVYAEDTRVGKKLLSHLNLKKEVKSYFKGNEIKKVSDEASYPLVCFTSPNRLMNDLKEFVTKDLQNEIVVCRELTKKFESIYRGTAEELLKDIPENKYRGEVTLVIDKSDKLNTLDIDIENLAKKLIEFQVPKREIAKIISSLSKEKVNKIYDSIKNL